MKKGITLADLGRSLGLDKSSVSLALRGSRKIAPATQELVRDTARRMGYRLNLAARQLRTQRAQVLALVLPESMSPLTSAVAVASIQHLATIAHRAALLFHILSDTDAIQPTDSAAGETWPMDAAMIWGAVPATVVAVLEKMNVPSVVIDPSHPSYRSFAGPSVWIDNREGGRAMARYLAGQGCRDLLFVQVISDHLGHRERWQGARQEWRKLRPRGSLLCRDYSELTDRELREFASQKHRAIFCSNDEGAKRILYRLMALGIRVPNEIVLAGFDADELCRSIGLPTVQFNWQALAEVAFELLRKLLSREQPIPTVRPLIPISVVPGAMSSCDCPGPSGTK